MTKDRKDFAIYLPSDKDYFKVDGDFLFTFEQANAYLEGYQEQMNRKRINSLNPKEQQRYAYRRASATIVYVVRS